jgi:SAM-dependent methyltransferase
MDLYQNHVLPFVIHLAMSNRELAEYRQRTISAARGSVLEIGIGSGLNLSRYNREVSGICGIDPSAGLLAKAAGQGITKAFLVRGSAGTLPFADGTFDTVVTTWTLCSIPDALSALREMKRVLRPDGSMLFVEHGLAPDRAVARWQNRLNPCWKCLGGGCHLNRKIDDLITASGFGIERLDTGYIRGRNPLTYMYEGVARPAG